MSDTALARMIERWATELIGSVATRTSTWQPRDKQRPPTGAWFVWMVLAGRGFGKTRTGGEWFDEQARKAAPGEQLLIAGRTPSDVRDYALQGPGGILTHHPDVQYEPSSRRLIWPNGAIGLIRSGANPEEFRGFSGSKAWLDELFAWDYPTDCWDNLIYGVREKDPRICITSTPRPVPLIKRIMAMESAIVVRGHSRENTPNLSPEWIKNVIEPLEGTRLGRQENAAEILDDTEGALWRLDLIDRSRAHPSDVPALVRVVVGVDPQGVKSSVDDDRVVGGVRVGRSETGIVAAGVDGNGHYYVLEDASINGTPLEWGTRAVATLDRRQGDRILGEKNFGGEMVEHVVRTVRRDVPFAYVQASRGKRQRAEPIASLYERGLVHHVGTFAALEDEMTTFVPGMSQHSPNRMDACCWALAELSKAEEPKYAGTWSAGYKH